MSKLNLLVVLNSYSDSRASNAPNLVNFKWARDIQAISADGLLSQSLVIPASGTVTLFTGASPAKKFVYVEAAAHVTMLINGTINEDIKPFVNGTSVQPGLFMRTSDITSLAITNPGTEEVEIFFAAVE